MKMKSFAHMRQRTLLIATLALSVTAITGIKQVWAAGISHTPIYPLVGQSVTFTGSCSYPPCDGYGWYFGDGTNGNGSPVNHAYSAAGTYNVHLVVGDANGNIENAYASVTVIGILVVGHVYANNNSAIGGATVKMFTQDGNTLLGTTSTDSNGYYQIGGSGPGTYKMTATKSFYWEEWEYVSPANPGDTVTGDFHLPQDLFYPVANIIVMYDSINPQQTRADLTWSTSTTTTVEVDASVGAVGGNFQVSVGTTTSGGTSTSGDSTVTSLLYQRGVEVHGIFWKQNPSPPVDVWVIAQQDVFGQATHMIDYMSSPPPSGGDLQYVPANTWIAHTYTQTSSFALRYDLQVDVSVNLELVSFTTKLASILVQAGTGASRTMQIQVFNIDTVQHSYYFYYEGSGVAHVWQVT